MTLSELNLVLSGAIFIGCWAIGLFFFRFQKRKGDRFFGFFGWAFFLLAFERALLVAVNPTDEFKAYIYLIRLVAFLFILYAIYDKNRSSEDSEPRGPERR
ncbi:MAG TPA: DUF5985 family protein [Verrucomicrobiae bacterium]|nr:DUF5985 family protein [Verrucomicrobiae bacterium]